MREVSIIGENDTVPHRLSRSVAAFVMNGLRHGIQWVRGAKIWQAVLAKS
jgi:hypothetical protein